MFQNMKLKSILEIALLVKSAKHPFVRSKQDSICIVELKWKVENIL